MCACKDAACAEKTFEDYKKWEDEMEKTMKDKVDKSKMEKFEPLEREMQVARAGARGRTGDALRAPSPSPCDRRHL